MQKATNKYFSVLYLIRVAGCKEGNMGQSACTLKDYWATTEGRGIDRMAENQEVVRQVYKQLQTSQGRRKKALKVKSWERYLRERSCLGF